LAFSFVEIGRLLGVNIYIRKDGVPVRQAFTTPTPQAVPGVRFKVTRFLLGLARKAIKRSLNIR